MLMPVLSVKDVDASVAFYRDVLGFKHEYDMPGPDGKTYFSSVTVGDAMLSFELKPEESTGGKGVLLMIEVTDDTDIDTYYAEVQARGAVIETPIKDEFWGDRTFGLRDPDGYALSLYKTVKQMTTEEITAAIQAQQPG